MAMVMANKPYTPQSAPHLPPAAQKEGVSTGEAPGALF
jgi:hypothetical protein